MAQVKGKRLLGAFLSHPSPCFRRLSSSCPPLIAPLDVFDEPAAALNLPSVSRVRPVGMPDCPLRLSPFPSLSSFPGPTLPPFFRPQPALSQLGPRHCFPIGGFPTALAKSPLFLSSPSPLLSQSATPFHWPSALLNRRTELPLPTDIPPPAFISKEVAELRFQSIREITRKLGAPNWDVVRLQRGSLVIKEEQNVDGIDHEVLNWPNAISFSRLLAGPILAWMLMHGYTQQAFFGFFIAGLSDWLDGYVARRQGINSVVGSYLDPLADKVLVGCVVLSMAQCGLLSPGLVALIIARDGALVCGAFVHRAYTMKWKFKSWKVFFNFWEVGAEKMEPLFISKVNTVLQLGLVSTVLLQSAFAYPDTYSLVPLMSWAVAFTTCASWGGYALKYMRQQPRTTSAALSIHADASSIKQFHGVKQKAG